MPQMDETGGILCVGHSKWTTCSPLHHFCSSKILIFSFLLGGKFLLPQKANSKEGEFCQFHKWMRQGEFSAWGIENGPLAALEATFVQAIFKNFSFYTGRPFLNTP